MNITAHRRRMYLGFSFIFAATFVSPQLFPQDLPQELHALRQFAKKLEKEIQARPNDLTLRVSLAEAEMKSGNLDKAKSALKAVLDRAPGFVPAMAALGQVSRRMFDYPLALQTLERASAGSPRDSAVRAFAADLSMDRMDFDAANALYETMLRENPANAAALCGLAMIAYCKDDYQEADRLVGACLERDSSFAKAWLLKSLLHRIRQENTEWAECGRRAVKYDPLDDEARANLFNILIRGEKKPAEGYAQARIALELNPFNLTTHTYIGNGWTAREYPLLSVEMSGMNLQEFLEATRVGDSLLSIHHLPSALHQYNSAVRLAPKSIPALIGKGTSLYYLQRYDEALKCFFAALDVDPDYALAHYGVAMTLLRKRDAVNVLIAKFRERTPIDAPEPPSLKDVFTNYPNLDDELQRIVRTSVTPLQAYLPLLKREKVEFLIFPFHHFLWQVPFNRGLKGKRTFDGRLWDDVKGSGGKSACAGEEWERDVRNFRFNVLTHEFAHQVHGFLPKNLKDEITRLYTAAKKERKTLDFYSDANENEYFAVGVEAYVSEHKLPDQKITYGHTRAELQRIDPDLYQFIAGLNDLAEPMKN